MPRLDEPAQACYSVLSFEEIEADIWLFAGEIAGLLKGLVT